MSEAIRRLQELLRHRGETVGCAESLTGGSLAVKLSETDGSSATFAGGVVSYATRVKRDLLGVTATEVVSAECAAQMAVGARRRLGVDWAMATTGVAGPAGQEDQAVGTVFVAVAGPAIEQVRRLALDGDRGAIRAQSCEAAIDLLVEVLQDDR